MASMDGRKTFLSLQLPYYKSSNKIHLTEMASLPTVHEAIGHRTLSPFGRVRL